ncbi:hypothetical protein NLI96_g2007 [Meripilus lineatus]|uniref:WD40 repeat-like protein n=1 Tax=Meripilus lineatus TaxID=2056292 RepID=A0AAD5YME1_9APHY|nr:hypothetical protein NLI96_g2007 [Physisporinus lineatus]
MVPPLMITADEVNCLIYAYFEDSGFHHSAFVLRAEGRLEHSQNAKKRIPRGELVELLSKALLYSEVEAHWKGNAMTTNCTGSFSLLDPHVCSLDPSLPATTTFNPPPPSFIPGPVAALQTNGSSEKRKASTPAMDDLPKGKRARTEDMDVESVPSSAAPTKASTPVPSVPVQTPRETLPKAITLLKAHKAEVFVCAWNPSDPKKLASGSKDTIVHMWDLPVDGSKTLPPPPLTLAHLPKPDQADLTSLDWNHDGSLLAIGSYDAILRVCTSSCELYFAHEQHKSVSSECCLDVDWLNEEVFASCGADGKIHIMNINSDTPTKTLTGHTSEVNQIFFSSSRTKLASCSDDNTARIWDVEDLLGPRDPAERVKVLSGHQMSVSTIAWSPHSAQGANEILATSGFDGTARLWDSVTGECLQAFSDHKMAIFALAFSPDARFFTTGGGDGWLHVYDVESRSKCYSWFVGQGRPLGIFEIAWQQSGNANRLAVALESREVGILDVTKIPALQ